MNDKIKIPSIEGASIMFDTSICSNMYLMAKVCSNDEIDVFFDAMNDRLVDQEFTQVEIDSFIKTSKEVILSLKEQFDKKEAGNGNKAESS